MALAPSLTLLRTVPLFRQQDDQELERVLRAPGNVVQTFAPLQTIIREGEHADCMYVILEGAVDVRITAVDGREVAIATLKEGDFFGEQALLPGANGRRNATVRALRPTRLLRILKADVLRAASRGRDADFPELGGVEGAEGADLERRMRMVLRSSRLFRALSEADLAKATVWTEIAHVPPGELIVRELERGDCMYLVLDGTVEVFVLDDAGKVNILARLGQGQYFGEQALLPSGTGVRNANVRANDAVTLVRIAPEFLRLALTRDRQLTSALQTIGLAQRKKIQDLRRPGESW